MTMLDAAIRYAERGWHVFPAKIVGKVKKSFKSAEFSNGRNWGATNDAEEIRSNFIKWPNACVGLTTGKASGFFIIEADTKEGHDVDGIASLRELEAEYGALPETLMAESPSGSLHYYFKWPSTLIRNSTSKIAPGVDVRGEGGMVIAPPSVRPGKGAYKWLNDNAVADAPLWLIELAIAGDGDEERRSGDNPQADPELVALAVALFPNEDIGWEDWNNIGMAIWHATNGKGFAAFDTFSKKSKAKYDAADTSLRWAGYFKSPPTKIGAGTLFMMAYEIDPCWRDAYDDAIEAAYMKASAGWLAAAT
jgi:hypothetical protein